MMNMDMDRDRDMEGMHMGLDIHMDEEGHDCPWIKAQNWMMIMQKNNFQFKIWSLLHMHTRVMEDPIKALTFDAYAQTGNRNRRYPETDQWWVKTEPSWNWKGRFWWKFVDFWRFCDWKIWKRREFIKFLWFFSCKTRSAWSHHWRCVQSSHAANRFLQVKGERERKGRNVTLFF